MDVLSICLMNLEVSLQPSRLVQQVLQVFGNLRLDLGFLQNLSHRLVYQFSNQWNAIFISQLYSYNTWSIPFLGKPYYGRFYCLGTLVHPLSRYYRWGSARVGLAMPMTVDSSHLPSKPFL